MSAVLLDREEYVEQAYLFRVFRERLEDNSPAQDILKALKEEVLATTRLPLAIDFLIGELHHKGQLHEGMQRLSHYFTAFQAFVVAKAEEEKTRLDLRVALQILQREAEFRAGADPLLSAHPEMPAPTTRAAALFMYQFECLAKNRLGYEAGVTAIGEDPLYDASWRDWIGKLRMQLGTTEFAELVYLRSAHRVAEFRKRTQRPDYEAPYPVLFGVPEGRIAKANIGKDPLYLFSALQRQLGYPAVPRPPAVRTALMFEPHVESRFQRLEGRLNLLEAEQRGGIDLTKFYKAPPEDVQ